jgi:hypothetical protein
VVIGERRSFRQCRRVDIEGPKTRQEIRQFHQLTDLIVSAARGGALSTFCATAVTGSEASARIPNAATAIRMALSVLGSVQAARFGAKTLSFWHQYLDECSP